MGTQLSRAFPAQKRCHWCRFLGASTVFTMFLYLSNLEFVTEQMSILWVLVTQNSFCSSCFCAWFIRLVWGSTLKQTQVWELRGGISAATVTPHRMSTLEMSFPSLITLKAKVPGFIGCFVGVSKPHRGIQSCMSSLEIQQTGLLFPCLGSEELLDPGETTPFPNFS